MLTLSVTLEHLWLLPSASQSSMQHIFRLLQMQTRGPSPLANWGLQQESRRTPVLVGSSRSMPWGSQLLFILPGSCMERRNVGASKHSLGKRAGIPRAVWLAPVPLGVMKSSSNCVYANREPMLTALQEEEWWAKHAPAALQQS